MQNIKTFIRMYRQLIQILNKRQKITAISVAFLAMVSALLETLGVSVVLPFILAMLQPEELMEKAEYYLKHDKEREEIAQNGYRKAKEHYSLERRVRQMLEIALGTGKGTEAL